MVGLCDNGTISMEPKLVADFKTNGEDLERAEGRSLGYCFQSLNRLSKPTQILMSCRKEKYNLCLCLENCVSHDGIAKELACIKICESSTKDSSQFLQVTNYAISHLADVNSIIIISF